MVSISWMIWRDTTHVGMALAVSRSGIKYVVMRYSPPGNRLGQSPLALSGGGPPTPAPIPPFIPAPMPVQVPTPIPAPPPAPMATTIPAPIFARIPADVPALTPTPTPALMPTSISAPIFTRVPVQVPAQIITQTRTEQSVQSTTRINSNWEHPAGNNNQLVSQYQPIPGPEPWAYNNCPKPPDPPNPMGPQMFPGPSGPPPPPITGPGGPLLSPFTGPIVAPPFVNFPPAPRPPEN
jgi:hypothetical protein